MLTPNLIIADPSEDFRKTLALELENHFHICLCQDGYEAIAALDSDTPTILVVDPTLSGIDGISLLQHAAKCSKPPIALVTSRFFSDYMLDTLHRLGVAYVMSKPCDIHCISARIFDLAQHLPAAPSECDSKAQVSSLLLKLSLRPKLAGYTYLTEGILRMMEQPDQSITKQLYPSIASSHRTTVNAVERSMRTAINGAWKRMDVQIWQQFFPADTNGLIPRPTNADFLSCLAANVANFGLSHKK